jgi:hypothetical protein
MEIQRCQPRSVLMPLPILPLPVSGEAAPPARVRDPKCCDSECAAAQSGLDGDLAVTAHPPSFRAFSLVSSRAQPRDPGSFSCAAAQRGLDGDSAVTDQRGVDGDLAVTAHSLSFCAFSLVSSRPESALVSSRAESAQPRDPGSFSFAACPCHLPVRKRPPFTSPVIFRRLCRS